MALGAAHLQAWLRGLLLQEASRNAFLPSSHSPLYKTSQGQGSHPWALMAPHQLARQDVEVREPQDGCGGSGRWSFAVSLHFQKIEGELSWSFSTLPEHSSAPREILRSMIQPPEPREHS